MSNGLSKKYSFSKDYWSIIISIYIVLLTITLFMVLSPDFFHWFIVPVGLSGIIIGVDAIDWVRKKIDIFDPIGFLGLFGFHFFFLAPLLQIYWDYGMTYVFPPEDWRPWIGGMAFINLLGLVVYKLVRKIIFEKLLHKRKAIVWKINKRKLFFISMPLLLIMGALQFYIYSTHGGVLGYITSYVERDGSFEGKGWLFMISESFPIIGIILLAVFLRNTKYQKKHFITITLLIIFFIIRMFFGGLRGSRSNTIWALIWATGILHFWLKPISRKFIYQGLAFLFVFIYIYGIYKGAGFDVLNAIKDHEQREKIVEDSGRGVETVLLGDLGRTNVQSFILYKLYTQPEDYNLSYGRSYIGDISILIPKSIWPDRPPTKVKEGTEIIRGKNSYYPEGYTSSRIYGLTGEFMLNFGYFFVPLIFAVLGFFVAKVRSLLYLYDKNDSRFLIYPFLIVCSFLLLVQDLDNLVFSIFKNMLIPFIVVWFSSEKVNKSKNAKS